MKKTNSKQQFLPAADSFRKALEKTGFFVGFSKEVPLSDPSAIKEMLNPEKKKKQKKRQMQNQMFLWILILGIMLFILMKL